MIAYIKFDDSNGVWANDEKAKEYINEGYTAFADETCSAELTADEITPDIETADETIETEIKVGD